MSAVNVLEVTEEERLYRREHHLNTEAGYGARQPQVKENLESSKTGRGKEILSPEVSAGSVAPSTP